MSRPAMTEDQREVVVALLANAIRKHHGRQAQATAARRQSEVLSMFGAFGRSEGSSQYVRGMLDLLAVLFEGGRAVADECYEAALAEAGGRQQVPDD